MDRKHLCPTAGLFAGLALALLATSCLTPPGALPGATAAAKQPRTTALPAKSLGDFSRDAAAVLADLRIGWNLGNSLDVPEGETAWGNPRTTPELLKAVAKAGFKVVRIPVTWSRRLGPGPAFTIEPAFLERVEEVVGYARDAGLYSIINVHHDGADGMAGVAWLSLKDDAGKTTPEHNAEVKAQFVAVWSQIAKYFANQGEEVMFEAMNEIHDGYGKPSKLHMNFVNELDQAFVDLVRASGGNNDKRHLIVPGYNTNIDNTLEGFALPKDPAKGRLILTVHYYDPYLFTLMGKTHTWGAGAPGRDDFGQEDFVVRQFDRIKERFIAQGTPVIIGEYGAVHQDGYEDYRRYYMEYVTKAAVDRGLVPIFWDNGAKGSGGERFALFDRTDNSVCQPAIVETILRAATKSYTLKDIAPAKAAK